jgi:hypothetical protein
MHWATYKACCRREGAWKVNMNEELASPILTCMSSAWESVFVLDLADSLKTLMNSLVAQVASFHATLVQLTPSTDGSSYHALHYDAVWAEHLTPSSDVPVRHRCRGCWARGWTRGALRAYALRSTQRCPRARQPRATRSRRCVPVI